MKTALTIAGSDSSGGAGIQADIKTMTANGVYAMSAITALTAQNTTGVTGIFETTPDFLAKQLDAVFTDIFPDAVKIGMVSSAELIEVIAEKLRFYGAKNIVVDPVMVATSGSKLLRDDAVKALTEQLLPMADLLTPNIPETEILSGRSISDAAGMEAAARYIRSTTPTTCCGGMAAGNGSAAAASRTLTPTGPDAPCPAPLRPTSPRAMISTPRSSAPKPTFPAHSPQCWTSATAPAPWTTCSRCRAISSATDASLTSKRPSGQFSVPRVFCFRGYFAQVTSSFPV